VTWTHSENETRVIRSSSLTVKTNICFESPTVVLCIKVKRDERSYVIF